MTTEQVSTFINLLMPVIVFLASWLSHRLYASLKPDQQDLVKKTADLVVPAVQQQFDQLSNQAKRQQAASTIAEILAAMGVKSVSPALIDTAIEAAVYAMKQQQQPAVPQLPAQNEQGTL